jgi:cytochrome c
MVLKIALAGVCAAVLSVLLSFAHPFGNPREVDAPSGQLLAGAQIPESLRKIVEVKCGNCHSEATEWPFYARVAPVSWLLERDVVEARGHMNLSRWETYGRLEQLELLSRVAAQARSGEMPPARYTAIHRDSKLLPEERDALYDWARAERKRLNTEGSGNKVNHVQINDIQQARLGN